MDGWAGGQADRKELSGGDYLGWQGCLGSDGWAPERVERGWAHGGRKEMDG